MNVKGDLVVSRTGQFGRRANEGLNGEVLAADRAVVIHDYAVLELDGGAADRNVVLPDATTLPNGWKLGVHNYGATNSLVVQDNSAAPLQTQLANVKELCYYILLDNSTAAGNWFVGCLTEPATYPAARFLVTFLSTDFPAAAGGYKTLTLTQKPGLAAATHGRGVAPMIQTQELSGTDYDRVLCDRERSTSAGNVELRVTDGAEFSGRAVLM